MIATVDIVYQVAVGGFCDCVVVLLVVRGECAMCVMYRYVGPIGSVRFYRCVIRCGCCVIFHVTTQSYMSNVACRTAVPVMHDANSGLGSIPNCVRTYGVRQRYPTNRSTNNQYTQPQSIDAIPVLLELWSSCTR